MLGCLEAASWWPARPTGSWPGPASSRSSSRSSTRGSWSLERGRPAHQAGFPTSCPSAETVLGRRRFRGIADAVVPIPAASVLIGNRAPAPVWGRSCRGDPEHFERVDALGRDGALVSPLVAEVEGVLERLTQGDLTQASPRGIDDF